MVFTLFPQTLKKEYMDNFYRVYKFDDDHFLITTDHGAWVVLNSKEYRLLRTHMVHLDPFLFSILEEKGIIVTEENVEKISRMYRERYHFLFYGPTLHIVIPTFRCNMKCIYCHSVSKPPNVKGYDMDEDTAKSVVDFIFTSPSKSLVIEFQGGEPLLNFDIVKFIIEYAKKKAIKTNKKVLFSLVTNLTAMDEEKLQFLKKHKIRGISTSLDGPKEVHDKNRKYIGGYGSWEDVVYWIKRIKTEFKYDFNLNAMLTVTKFSLPYWKEIVDTYVKLGFNFVWFRFMNNLGFAHVLWKKIGYEPEEFLEFYKKGLDYLFKVNKNGYKIFEVFALILGRKILNIRDPMFVDIQSPCGAVIGQLLYNHKGDIFTCDEAKILGDVFKLGNVKTSTIKDVLLHPITLAMMNLSSKLPLICDSCPWSPYCGVCPVNFYVTQGSIVPKLREDYRCKILQGIIKFLFEKIIFDESKRRILINWVNSNIIK